MEDYDGLACNFETEFEPTAVQAKQEVRRNRKQQQRKLIYLSVSPG
jgi:hypothetical protein